MTAEVGAAAAPWVSKLLPHYILTQECGGGGSGAAENFPQAGDSGSAEISVGWGWEGSPREAGTAFPPPEVGGQGSGRLCLWRASRLRVE